MKEDAAAYAALRADLSARGAEVEGLFGPESVSWRVLRELALLFGGGRALLLQLAHPAVSAGVQQHSGYHADLAGRTLRTFGAVYAIVFGDRASALRLADQVHARHQRVRGVIGRARPGSAPYRALDPALLLWVHATLTDTTVRVYELLVGPLPDADKEALYREGQVFAAAFGLAPSAMPPDYRAFVAYVDAMLAGPVLRAGAAERAMREQLVAADNLPALVSGLLQLDDPRLAALLRAVPALGRGAQAILETATGALLPERLAREFGLPYGRRTRLELAALAHVLRGVVAATPKALRYAPSYHRAVARVALARGRPVPPTSRAHLALLRLAQR